jgi:hypothetical protein
MTETAETHLYVYGVVPADTALPELTGLDDAPMRLVAHEDLAAIVSDIPAGELRPTGARLKVHLERLTTVAGSGTVLPMRFGVVLPDEPAVKSEVLAGHAERLRELLTAFRGRAELEVRGTFEEGALMAAAVAARPEIEQARQAIAGKPADATYYERIQLGEQVAAAVADHREAIRERMLAELSPLALDVRVGEPAHELDAYSAAFLVETERMGEFDEAVDRLAAAQGDLVKMKYFGPLPPHSFVELEGGTPAWA